MQTALDIYNIPHYKFTAAKSYCMEIRKTGRRVNTEIIQWGTKQRRVWALRSTNLSTDCLSQIEDNVWSLCSSSSKSQYLYFSNVKYLFFFVKSCLVCKYWNSFHGSGSTQEETGEELTKVKGRADKGRLNPQKHAEGRKVAGEKNMKHKKDCDSTSGTSSRSEPVYTRELMREQVNVEKSGDGPGSIPDVSILLRFT